ncbi:hypothetical protein FACS1894132_02340 [Clostridia bacterium]|nr:hypothetical protein FACS1894132_02340 [Clostridia bacterium]
MKKTEKRPRFLPLLLAFVMLVTLSACNKNTQGGSSTDPPTSTPEPAVEVTASTPPASEKPSENVTEAPTEQSTEPKTEPPKEVLSASEPPKADAPKATASPKPAGTTKPVETSKPAETQKPTASQKSEQKPTETQKPTEQPTTTPTQPDTPEPTTTPKAEDPPKQTGRAYDMNDPNVKKYPIYATAKNAAEFKAGMAAIGKTWKSAAEIIANQKDPDNTIDGVLFYDLRMKPIQEWVDAYVAANGLSYKGKTDYQKTAIIKHVVENGRFEEFIGLWRPGFNFADFNASAGGSCVPRSEAVQFLMVAMGFKLLNSVGCMAGEEHVTNAYWDSEANAVRFVDSDLGFGVWNLYVDELDEMGFVLD